MKGFFGVAALLLMPAPLLAQSNIGLDSYPAPKCDKPAPVDPELKPAPPPGNPSNDQAEAFNNKVRKYNDAVRSRNAQVASFNTCMQAYVAAGNADMKRITDAINAAVAQANAD
jgi:hypothetical protein